LDSNGSIFTISELNQQQEDMMKPGYKMDPMAAYVGQLFGIDPLAVINRQRLAAGMEALQLPESTMSFSNTVNPALKRMLDSYQTPQTSTRAMISTRTFNPTLVPKGYGSLVVQAAQNANINPIYVAAFAEAENGSWDTNAFSMGGSAAGVGLMQLNQAYFGSEQQLQDPAYNLNTGAQELARLAGNYSNWRDIIYAWNMGETGFANWVAAGRPDTAQAGYAAGLYERFEKARAKYGDVSALQSRGTMRNSFVVRQYVSGDPAIQGMNTGSVIYDPIGHGGQAYHNHYEFATKEQAAAAKKLYESKGYRVTSYIRPGDSGAHGGGYAIDVAPSIDLPYNEEAEARWSAEANAVIGYNPLQR